MLQSASSEHHESSPSSSGSGIVRRPRIIRWLEYLAGALAVAIVAYIVFFSVRLARGVTRTSGEAASVVRLQILNGTGMRGMASWMTDRLSGYADRDLEIKVVDSGDFDLTEVAASFVISRDQDLALARLVAERLGLDQAGVVYKPLPNNHRLATATLVLGRDYSRITLNTQASKEK